MNTSSCFSMSIRREVKKIGQRVVLQRNIIMKLHNKPVGRNPGYKEAVEALNSLQTNAQLLQKLRANKALGQENNVIRTKKYLERSGVSLDRLDRELSVIHVSGTKGKGSTCVMCEAILRQMGYKTGFFSSPHLVAVRERIRINQAPLSETEFTKHFWTVYNKLAAAKDDEHDMPSYFKFLTVMAFNVFLTEKVDVAIIEVGIGGEYDCTNVFKRPAVVGISSLGLDHTSLLGSTIEDIAWQKGGIMKPGTLAFTSPQPPSAATVLHQRAVERKCPLWEVPPLSTYDWQGQEMSVGLRGRVQQINASLALQLANAWQNRNMFDKSKAGYVGVAKAFPVSHPVAEGLKHCSWPGRYQILTRKSIHGTCTYYLDGAHTMESIELCAQWFHQATNNIVSRGECRHTLIYNVTGDRDASELLSPLVSCHFDSALFCPNVLSCDTKAADLTNHMVTSRQQLDRCEENKKTWLGLERQTNVFANEVKTFGSVAATLKHIESQPGDHQVLVTGSLHLIGTVLSALDPDLNSFSAQPIR
ncbi:folylpolyglutamate synthase, mitochondrial-like [Macrosteles quadrilineatus]|uniref:folylpolyglutamate synthase, mitochondrial-like n=1 Tax=Macrosteles quadrilineatus TaxID=74068 RepID=UPI0023E2F064|nr:folylpolyglutamate synthase, mitochondrial-like [Macrosteles quadrilineatus]